MDNSSPVLEYKCPCCDAHLNFAAGNQKMACEYCGNSFDPDAVEAYNASNVNPDAFDWDAPETAAWSETEQEHLKSFQCPSCGGQILSEETTAATFCPYCDNPAVISSRISGGLKPDALIPFQNTKQDAQKAFLQLCKGKPLLPKDFASSHRLEKITGMYVPFWLYSCNGSQDVTYRATRVHHWSDSRYHYRRTDHFLLSRSAKAEFNHIPMDASQRMNNTIMESIEPFDFEKLMDFEAAYLAGYLADKYDVEHTQGEERIRQRVGSTLETQIRASVFGYATAVPTQKQLQIGHSRAKYVLLPVWMLCSRYKNKTYIFAMNGQTGKMTGTFPICPKRTIAWFCGICAAVTAAVSLIQYLAL